MARLFSASMSAANIDTLDAKAMRPWYAALANRDYAPANAVFFGDSITEGGPGTSAPYRRWLDLLNKRLHSQFLPGANYGDVYKPAYYVSYVAPSTVAPATYSGALVGYSSGLGDRSYGLSAAGDWIQFAFTGTDADLSIATHTTASTKCQISIDGGAGVLVTLGSVALTVENYAIRGLTSGAHTVRVTWDSVGPVVVNGIKAYDGDLSKGIHIYDAGKGSQRASQAVSSSTSRDWQPLKQIQPQLLCFAWGTNEYLNTFESSSSFAASLASCVANATANVSVAPTVMIMAYGQPGSASYSEPWSNYVEVMRAQAKSSTNGVFMDFSTRESVAKDDNSLGLYHTDLVHRTDKGHSFIADTLLKRLTPR